MSENEKKLQIAKEELKDLKAAYKTALETGSSWKAQDGNSRREVENYSITSLLSAIRDKEAEIANLEAKISGSLKNKAFLVGVKF